MAVKRIDAIREVRYDGGDKWIVADLQVSTEAKLPDLGDDIDGMGKIGAGSHAQIIQSGTIKTLDDDGNWYVWGGASE